MSEWVPANVPVFTVVGRVNMGKSAVLATLLEIDDNKLIRVSPTPGETTRCQTHRLIFNDKECIRFIDTPGFSQPIEAMREIQRLHGEGTPGLDAIRSFVNASDCSFVDEKRLLEPLLDGAGILYVVDPARPLIDDFLAEMEILRWTGRPRLALLNRRENATGNDEDAWKSRLGSAFNLTRTFDAHHARFEERIRLLKALLEIEEHHREGLTETIRLVEDEWRIRREEAAETIIEFLEDALSLRVKTNLSEKDLALDSRRKRYTETLTKRYYSELAGLEQKCNSALLKIYRHHLLKADVDATTYQKLDLESSETWSKWGLSRAQLVIAAGLTGGAAGLAVDAATGGITHGIGTLVGGLGSGIAAWFKGSSLPELRVNLHGGVTLDSGESKTLVIGPPSNRNFLWILMDAVLVRYQQILNRAHGRRDAQHLADEGSGFTRHFSSSKRAVFGKWFDQCLKGNRSGPMEPEVFAALVETLEESTSDHSGNSSAR
ncbi:MAG: GTPase/DUF3482 domain-containing protein [Gloeobacteraceae cyanobacterium ES-bin-144]|nr:GTPase/DUF3482 domain-containing protein [Verrucomicrobiales bacterium]